MSRKEVAFAGSNFDEDERVTGPIRDKKFEGYSNLKGAADKMKRRAHAQHQKESNKDLEEKIILNLQKQIATMENEIKLLKDREIDQKNQASGYETLLRDNIPLNEHFLALKNKYNNEKNEIENEVKMKEAEIQGICDANEDKRVRIQHLKAQYEEAQGRHSGSKQTHTKQTKDQETTLYHNMHQKTLLTGEKKVMNDELSKLRGENNVEDRAIKQNQLAKSKKDQMLKEKREHREEMRANLDELEQEILAKSWQLLQETTRYKDKNLVPNATAVTMAYRQEANQANIDISIAESRIRDFENQKQMAEGQIRQMLTEKVAVEKENTKLEQDINNLTTNEEMNRQRLFEAERYEEMKKDHEIQWERDRCEIMLEQLKEEERKCKEQLDKKIDAEQSKETVDEDADMKAKAKHELRDDIVQKKVQLSKLMQQLKRMAKESDELVADNTQVKKDNEKFEHDNALMQQQIMDLIKRIDVSTLLKELDITELGLLAENNLQMNNSFRGLINAWEKIKNQDDMI